MRTRWKHLVLVWALLTVGFATAEGQSGRIPTTHGTSFAGTEVTLPDDFKGKVGVLVLGFSKSSGDVCKGWGQRLAESYRNSHEVMYYQVPVLESVPKLIRGMVLKSMKSGVPETEQAHFMPTFTDEAEWKKIVLYANANDAYVLVVDGYGKVKWQTSGKVTDAGFGALKEQVEGAANKATGSALK
jgi:ATP10 protein